MKKLIALLFITAILSVICSLAFAADNINYHDAVVTTTFKKVEVRPAVIETITPADEIKGIPAETKEVEPAIYEMALDLPFKTYSETVYVDGKDVTYSYRADLSLEGKEALVYVHYRMKDIAKTEIKDETAKVRGYAGLVGETWEQVKAAPKYAEHFTATKADALATPVLSAKGEVLSTTKYAGVDAAEPVPMYIGMCGAPLKVEAAKEITEEPMEK